MNEKENENQKEQTEREAKQKKRSNNIKNDEANEAIAHYLLDCTFIEFVVAIFSFVSFLALLLILIAICKFSTTYHRQYADVQFVYV